MENEREHGCILGVQLQGIFIRDVLTFRNALSLFIIWVLKGIKVKAINSVRCKHFR